MEDTLRYGYPPFFTAKMKKREEAITAPSGWNLSAAITSGDGSITPASGNTGSGSAFTFTYTEGTAGTLVVIEVTLAQGEHYAVGQALLQL